MTASGHPPQTFAILKRPAVLAGVAILVVSAAGAGAWLTRPPAEAPPPRPPKAARMKPAVAPAAPMQAEAPAVPAAPAAPATATPEPAPAPAATSVASAPAALPTKPDGKPDWEAMPVRELRTKAEANEIPAMEELARRLVQGIGITKDQQAPAGCCAPRSRAPPSRRSTSA